MDATINGNLIKALNRLAKWRTVFASWQLGTRMQSDPECAAVKDHREVTLLLRAEVSALVGVLVAKGVFTEDEFGTALAEEAVKCEIDLERHFPGFVSSDSGMVMSMPEAAETMRRFPK